MMNNIKKRILIVPGWKEKRVQAEPLLGFFSKFFELSYFTYNYQEGNRPLTIDDYLNNLLIEIEDFKPQLILGYSFGGKLAGLVQKRDLINTKLLLVAPSLLKPPFSFIVWWKIRVYKVTKWLLFRRPYFSSGSEDYQLLNEIEKQTFNNVCHEYLKLSNLKIDSTTIVGYELDKKVLLKTILKARKKGCNIVIRGGDHGSYYKDYGFLVNLSKEILND